MAALAGGLEQIASRTGILASKKLSSLQAVAKSN
jgi:hypothetical protein